LKPRTGDDMAAASQPGSHIFAIGLGAPVATALRELPQVYPRDG